MKQFDISHFITMYLKRSTVLKEYPAEFSFRLKTEHITLLDKITLSYCQRFFKDPVS